MLKLLVVALLAPATLSFGLFGPSRPYAIKSQTRFSPLNSPSSHPSTKRFAYNIFDDTPKAESKHSGTDREVSEQISNQHKGADLETISPRAAFIQACASRAAEYSELQALTDPAIEGRAFTLFDLDEDGLIDLDEFVSCVAELRRPTTLRFNALASRLAEGRVSEAQSDFSNVKKVAIVGAGVAGLQTAKALRELGKEVVIFEKSANVGGVWRKNYADFGLQVPQSLYEFPDFP